MNCSGIGGLGGMSGDADTRPLTLGRLSRRKSLGNLSRLERALEFELAADRVLLDFHDFRMDFGAFLSFSFSLSLSGTGGGEEVVAGAERGGPGGTPEVGVVVDGGREDWKEGRRTG
jgi:hypothetical protein